MMDRRSGMGSWEKFAQGIWLGQPYMRKGDADWCVIVKRKDYSGGRRRYIRIGADYEAARQLAKDILRDLAQVGSARATIDGLLSEFEAGHVCTLKRRTESLYLSLIKNHLRPQFGELRASDLRPKDFFRFGETYLEPLSQQKRWSRFALVRQNLSVMRKALNWYWNEHPQVMRGIECPAALVGEQIERIRKRYEIPKKRARPIYTREQAETLLEVARSVRPLVHDLYSVGFGTGMRLGEVLGIQWDNIDWLNCQIVAGEMGLWKIAKDGRPELYKFERDVHEPIQFPNTLLDLFHRLRQNQTSDRWIFASRNGTPLLQSNVHKQIKVVREMAAERGVPKNRTFHSTRHSFASFALEAGHDLEFVRNQLGHHSAAFTAAQYTHLVPGKRDMGFAAFGQSGHQVVTVVTDRNSLVSDVYDASTEDLEEKNGDPGAIRTRDPQLRRLVLYPAELPGHNPGGT